MSFTKSVDGSIILYVYIIAFETKVVIIFREMMTQNHSIYITNQGQEKNIWNQFCILKQQMEPVKKSTKVVWILHMF